LSDTTGKKKKKNPNSWFNVIKVAYVFIVCTLGYKNVCYGSFLRKEM